MLFDGDLLLDMEMAIYEDLMVIVVDFSNSLRFVLHPIYQCEGATRPLALRTCDFLGCIVWLSLDRIEKSDTGFGKLAVKFDVALLDCSVHFTISLLIEFKVTGGQANIFPFHILHINLNLNS